jgi:hypothetical protein
MTDRKSYENIFKPGKTLTNMIIKKADCVLNAGISPKYKIGIAYRQEKTAVGTNEYYTYCMPEPKCESKIETITLFSEMMCQSADLQDSIELHVSPILEYANKLKGRWAPRHRTCT